MYQADSQTSESPINLDAPENSNDFQILFTGSDKSILVTGNTNIQALQILKQNKCHITRIETHPQISEMIKYADKTIAGNIEHLNFEKEFVAEKFDVILLDDILEHIYEPIKFLQKLHFLLNDDGHIIFFIHNSSYTPIRLSILNGNCMSTNNLSEKNRYFHTLNDVNLLLNKSDFRIAKLQRIKGKFDFYKSDMQQTSFSDDLIASFTKDPESETFQFVFKAKKSFVDIKTREYLINNFPKNYVTEELKRKIDDYIRHIQYYTQQIQHHEKVIADKDQIIKHYEDTIENHIKQINEIKNSKIWKVARLIDKFRK